MERVFVYGSLQPGGSNEHVLAGVEGTWEPAVVRGRLVEDGWGATLGYPALVLDASAGEVPGHVLTSSHLVGLWADLDAFEGSGYERVTASATLGSGAQVSVEVYVLRT